MLWAMIQEGAHAAAPAAEHASSGGGGGHHVEVSPIVMWVNNLLGPVALKIEEAIMPPLYGAFGKQWTPPAHGEEIPGHVIFAFIAFLVCTVGVLLFRGEVSVDNPSKRQQVLEVLVDTIRGSLDEVVGPFGRRYLPVITAFALFILVSNLMGLVPLLDAPTGSYNVTLALGLSSFLYYITRGFSQQGLGYLKHFTGGIGGYLAPFAALIFVVEIVSNLLRPITLSVRLVLNMFADHAIGGIVSGLAPWVAPALSTIPLASFVAFVQTLVFVMLSMVYLSETVPHEEHDHDEHGEHGSRAEHQAAHAH